MRILLLNQFYPPSIAPTGKLLHDLATSLFARGHEIHVITSSEPEVPGGASLASSSVMDGIHVHRISTGTSLSNGMLLKASIQASYLLSTFLFCSTRLQAMDCIISQTTPPLLGLLAARLARRWHSANIRWIMDVYPNVLEASGLIESDSLGYSILNRLTLLDLRDSHLVLTIGEFMQQIVAELLPTHVRSECVPLWADPSLYPWEDVNPPRIRTQRGWSHQDVVCLYSGNMGWGHRFEDFLTVAANGPAADVIWAFAGGGKRLREISDFSAAHVGARIQVLPYVAPTLLREHMCSADIHLVSLESGWDGLIVPSKIQGIFAVGKPVLFVGGDSNEVSRWIRQSGAGWVVRPGDIDELRAALAQARDPEERRRRGKCARIFAKHHFDHDTNCTRLADLILETARTHNTKRSQITHGT